MIVELLEFSDFLQKAGLYKSKKHRAFTQLKHQGKAFRFLVDSDGNVTFEDIPLPEGEKTINVAFFKFAGNHGRHPIIANTAKQSITSVSFVLARLEKILKELPETFPGFLKVPAYAHFKESLTKQLTLDEIAELIADHANEHDYSMVVLDNLDPTLSMMTDDFALQVSKALENSGEKNQVDAYGNPYAKLESKELEVSLPKMGKFKFYSLNKDHYNRRTYRLPLSEKAMIGDTTAKKVADTLYTLAENPELSFRVVSGNKKTQLVFHNLRDCRLFSSEKSFSPEDWKVMIKKVTKAISSLEGITDWSSSGFRGKVLVIEPESQGVSRISLSDSFFIGDFVAHMEKYQDNILLMPPLRRHDRQRECPSLTQLLTVFNSVGKIKDVGGQAYIEFTSEKPVGWEFAYKFFQGNPKAIDSALTIVNRNILPWILFSEKKGILPNFFDRYAKKKDRTDYRTIFDYYFMVVAHILACKGIDMSQHDNEWAFVLGQIFAKADVLHVYFATKDEPVNMQFFQRRAKAPGQLIGSEYLKSAMQQPQLAFSRFSKRLARQGFIATAYKHKGGPVAYKIKQLMTQLVELQPILPQRAEPKDIALMMTGFNYLDQRKETEEQLNSVEKIEVMQAVADPQIIVNE